MTISTDAELISTSLSGNNEAFVELVERHEAAVWAYLVRRAGRQVAEDLLAEVWTGAYASRRRYDLSFPEARPWLFGIARNTLRRHWRSGTVEDPVADMSDVSCVSDPWSREDDRLDGQMLFHRVLATLPPDERNVLLLVAWEQLSVADAARVLEIPAGTARRLLHQARLALKSAPEMMTILTESNDAKERKCNSTREIQ
jgi:RNA polymerase sigma-70 factor (ECF subfamily)